MSSLRVHPRLRALMEDPWSGDAECTLAYAAEPSAPICVEPTVEEDAFQTVKLERPGALPLVFEGRLLITFKRDRDDEADIPLHAIDIYETRDEAFVASLRQDGGDWNDRVLCVAEGETIETVFAELKQVDPADRFAAQRLVTRIPDTANPALALKSLQAGIDALRYDLEQTLGLVVNTAPPQATS
ncbi:MAG: hypothetical protein AAGJ32_10945 [Pseudomonadota bacterium]